MELSDNRGLVDHSIVGTRRDRKFAVDVVADDIAVARRRADGALLPVCGRAAARLGVDLAGILKYKGKTNELFTAMALNLASVKSTLGIR